MVCKEKTILTPLANIRGPNVMTHTDLLQQLGSQLIASAFVFVLQTPRTITEFFNGASTWHLGFHLFERRSGYLRFEFLLNQQRLKSHIGRIDDLCREKSLVPFCDHQAPYQS